VKGVRTLLREQGSSIAAVIVEPVAGNMGVVPPAPEFLEMLREETRRVGSVLIFDEVITGFRLGLGGAQQRFGIEPDLSCFGKILGGGMPLAAFGGSQTLMQYLAPLGGVYQAGTLSGNPVSVATGLATLRVLEGTPDAFGRLDALGERAQAGLVRALDRHGVVGCVNRVGSMMTLFLGVGQVYNFADAARADTALFARFFREMLAAGFYLPPSQFEAMFWSLAHDASDVDAFVDAATDVLGRIRG
jgi:glutamate-1-semialdehyde 2,1-aminomutase